jgi:hypothetical protein
MMNIRGKNIVILFAAGFVSAGLGLAGITMLLPQGLRENALAGAIAEGVMALASTILALASALFIVWLDGRAKESERLRELVDAHKRLMEEIEANMAAARSLLSAPDRMETTLFPDDVWYVARTLIYSHHQQVEDPVNYALTDFYKRVKLMQINDSKRLDYLLGGGDVVRARGLVQRDCEAILDLGQNLIGPVQHADDGQIVMEFA